MKETVYELFARKAFMCLINKHFYSPFLIVDTMGREKTSDEDCLVL